MRPHVAEAYMYLSGYVDPRLASDLKQMAASSSPVIPSLFAYSGPIGLHFAMAQPQLLQNYQPPPSPTHWREQEEQQKKQMAQLTAEA
jgi:hypothetical protein